MAVWTKREKLKSGDHVYVRRKRVHGIVKVYTHHGIVFKKRNGKLGVIHFRKHEGDERIVERGTKTRGPMNYIRGKFSNTEAVKKRIEMKNGKMEIGEGYLSDFEEKDKGFLVYTYKPDKPAAGMEGSKHECIDAADTVDIAKWFVEEGHTAAFGSYDLHNWNCEHFASFCKTTTLRREQLEDQQPKPDGSISRDFLKENSYARSYQVNDKD